MFDFDVPVGYWDTGGSALWDGSYVQSRDGSVYSCQQGPNSFPSGHNFGTKELDNALAKKATAGSNKIEIENY